MKKLLLAAIAVLSMNVSISQDATNDSGGIHFGVKAGVNFATLSKDEGFKPDGLTSFHAGAVVEIPISEKFLIQPEIVYSSQGFKQDEYIEFYDVNIEITSRMDYINIPIMAGYTVIEGLVVQAGPQFGINIIAKNSFSGVPDFLEIEDDEDFKDDVKTLDIGFGFGAQYKLPFGLFFQARYTIGLNKVLDHDDANDHKNRVGSISVGYFFN